MQLLAGIISSTLTQELKYRMLEESFPKIKACLNLLTEAEVWMRTNESVNSVGNMILHLCGNVRQYIVSGAGGQKDIRERQKEFEERGPISKSELITKMEITLNEAASVLDRLSPEQLIEVKAVQCYEMSVLSMIVHATEHFSYHTGQIIYFTKMLKDIDMKFYGDLNLEAKGGSTD
ncbi:MAG TPA: DUF1572 domain-containing protein [Bacteroidetes bacterium]|nr:DUF1572 domain-containing protein [Bacteroidota bacterium]